MHRRSTLSVVLVGGLILGLFCGSRVEAQPAPVARTLIIISARMQAPLYQRTVVAIRGQLASAPVRIEIHWLDGTARNPSRYGQLARTLARRPGVVAVLWFELAVRAQAFFQLKRCGRPLVRNLESTRASGRVESLAIIVGTTVKIALQPRALRCPVAATPLDPAVPAPAPPPAPPAASPPLRITHQRRLRARWIVRAAYAAGFAYLYQGMRSDLSNSTPYVSGLGLGPQSFQLEMGYAVNRRLTLGVAARVGHAPSDTSSTPVIPWAVLGRARYYLVGGPRGPFSLYLGMEAGGGATYSSLVVGEPNVRDTFTHGPIILGGLAGMEIGWPGFGWFLELENAIVFPRHATYLLGVNTGVLVRF